MIFFVVAILINQNTHTYSAVAVAAAAATQHYFRCKTLIEARNFGIYLFNKKYVIGFYAVDQGALKIF